MSLTIRILFVSTYAIFQDYYLQEYVTNIYDIYGAGTRFK